MSECPVTKFVKVRNRQFGTFEVIDQNNRNIRIGTTILPPLPWAGDLHEPSAFHQAKWFRRE